MSQVGKEITYLIANDFLEQKVLSSATLVDIAYTLGNAFKMATPEPESSNAGVFRNAKADHNLLSWYCFHVSQVYSAPFEKKTSAKEAYEVPVADDNDDNKEYVLQSQYSRA